MKFLHTADWHLGRYLKSFSLKEDQHHMLKALRKIILREKPDAILLAGDIYDRSVPPAESVAQFDDLMHELIAEYHIPVIAIAGNHDSAQRIECYSGILERQQLYIKGEYDKSLKPIILHDEFGEVYIYAIPYIEPEMLRYHMGNDAFNTHEDCWRFITHQIKQHHPKGKRAVCVAHLFVQGGAVSDSERSLHVGGADQVSASLFSIFNYTALGHLHRAQEFLQGTVVYSGSPLKYSLSEAEHKKSVSIVEMDGMGIITRREIPIEPKRDVVRIAGHIREGVFVQENEQQVGISDYVEVSIMNDEPVLEAMRIVRNQFPNVIHLTFPKRDTEQTQSNRLTSAQLSAMQAEELAVRFFEQVKGEPISTQQLEWITKAFTAAQQEDTK